LAHLFEGCGEGDGGGALTVRSHDLHDVGDLVLGVAHRVEEGFDPLEAEGDVPAPVQLGTDLGISG
jgi:hypothetical protein